MHAREVLPIVDFLKLFSHPHNRLLLFSLMTYTVNDMIKGLKVFLTLTNTNLLISEITVINKQKRLQQTLEYNKIALNTFNCRYAFRKSSYSIFPL